MAHRNYNYKHLALDAEAAGAAIAAHSYAQVACRADHVWRASQVAAGEAEVTCPTCLGVIHRRQLDARGPEQPKLALEKAEVLSPYRFTYSALVGGEHVGFVVYEGAYGRAAWRICVHNLPDAKDRRLVGYQLDRDPKAERSYPLSFKTKEAALMACEALVAEGRLKSLAQTKAEAEAWRRQWATREAQIAAEEAAEVAEGDLSLEALDGLLDRGVLSNLERVAVTAARQALAKHLAQVRGSLARAKARAS